MLSEEYWAQVSQIRINDSKIVQNNMSQYRLQVKQNPHHHQGGQPHRAKLDFANDLSGSGGRNLNAHNSSAASQTDSNDEVSKYFQMPTPRKPAHTTYQNLPENSFYQKQRLETVTPNRFGDRIKHNLGHTSNDNSSDMTSGEFQRSASARLHRSNRKQFQHLCNQQEGGNDDSRKKEQVKLSAS